METYIDKNYAVTANTICSFFGFDEVLTVPGKVALVDIKAIGHGAFYGNKKLNTAIVPKEIESLGECSFCECDGLKKVIFDGTPKSVGNRAFFSCHSLYEIELRNFFVSKSVYEDMRTNSTTLSDGITVTARVPGELLPKGLLESLGTKYPAANIPLDVSELFYRVNPKDTAQFRNLFNEIQVFAGNQNNEAVREHQAFLKHIQGIVPETLSPLSEKANDDLIKSEESCNPEDVVIFTFNDTETRKAKNGYLLHVTLKIGHFFWQSAKKVICNGQEYFVYRRHHLTHKPEMEYIRQDVAIYTKNGLLNNKEEAKKVYAKYRLLSFI